MKPEDAEEYTQALGQVVAGGWRQIALGERLGVPKALKLSTPDWVKQRLGGYVKYSVEERRETVKALSEDGHKERAITRITGITRDVVRKELGKGGRKTTTHTRTATTPPTKNGRKTTTETEPLEVMTGLAVSQDARDAADRETQREQRERQRAQIKNDRGAPPLPAGTYRLLYADPPWRYEHVKTESRAVENQYPTMELDAICALQIPAAEDAVLFLWATSPKLAEAMRVIDAWGFTYRTCAVWDKEQIGMGYYFRQQHELLLVGAKGNAPVPDADKRLPSVFRSKRSEHSQKPSFVYGYLEAMYPAFTKDDRVELFSREAPTTWTPWSNEPGMAS